MNSSAAPPGSVPMVKWYSCGLYSPACGLVFDQLSLSSFASVCEGEEADKLEARPCALATRHSILVALTIGWRFGFACMLSDPH